MKVKQIITLLLLILVGACAQQLGEIDRVQHNVIKKDMLKGEWYFRQTTIEAPYASAYSFEGAQGVMERGVFEIQEKTLFFYRTYEFSQNTQQIGMKSDTDTPYKNKDGNYVGTKLLVQNDETGQAEAISCDNNDKVCVDGDGNEIPCPEHCIDSSCFVYRKVDLFCKQKTSNPMALCGKEKGHEDSPESYCILPKYVYRGAPVAAWPILSHFDIIYSYNPTTGEKSNVKVENTTDRMWFEREYMRVDWSSNLVFNFEQVAAFDKPEEYTPNGQGGNDNWKVTTFFTLYPGDADNPEDRPVLEDNYMDFTYEVVAEAPLEYYDDWGTYIPLCWFYPWYTGQILECVSETYKLRQSFMKVPEKDDYVPWNYSDKYMEKFGFFRSERLYYDPLYGTTYEGIIRHIQRHRIWKQYITDENGNLKYDEMEPTPIVYYLSQDFPRELVPEAKKLAKEWSQPFMDIVKYYKGSAPDFDMFIVCENSDEDAEAGKAWFEANKENLPDDATLEDYVAEYSGSGTKNSEFCKDMNKPKRNGDLRYNLLFAVVAPTEVGLYGYGPSSADPLTGEIISSTAYIYTAAMKIGANKILDRIETIAGVKDWTDILSADYIVEDQKAKRLKINGIYNFDISDKDAEKIAKTLISPKVVKAISTTGIEKTDINYAQARMQILHNFGKDLERMLISPEVRSLFRDYANWEKKGVTDNLQNNLAFYKWANHHGWEKRLNYYRKAAEKTMYLKEFLDNAIVGMALEYAKKYNEYICSDILQRIENGEDLIFDPTEFDRLLGECSKDMEGQTDDEGNVCVKVNQGSGISGYYWKNQCTVKKLRIQLIKYYMEKENLNKYDYDPYMRHYLPNALYMDSKYPEISLSQNALKEDIKKLRDKFELEIWKKIFYSVALHEVGHTLGLRHNFHGSADPMNYFPEFWKLKVRKENGEYVSNNLWKAETRTQILGKMREYQYSSIMDYGAKFNSDWHGLGLWDKAAIKFGYGELVEVFNKKPNLDKFKKYLVEPDDVSPDYVAGSLKPDEGTLKKLFDTVHYTQIPNLFGDINAIYDRKNVALKDLKDSDVVVPYQFCSDELAGRYPLCNIWDEGADYFELTWNALRDVEHYWLFWGTWHNDPLFWPENYYYTVLRKYKIAQQAYQYWVLNYRRYNKNDFWEKNFGKRWEDDINGGLSGTMAALWSLNYFGFQFGRPSPGTYGTRKHIGIDGQEYYTVEPIIWGKQSEFGERFRIYMDMHAIPMYNGWQSGGNDMYPVYAGSFYNRLAALEVLTDPTTDFIVPEVENTMENYLINYGTMFPDEVYKFLGSLTVGKIDGYGWIVVKDKNQLENFKGADEFVEDNYADAIGGYIVPRWIKEVPGYFENPDGLPLNPEQPDEYYFPTTKYRIPMLAAYYGMSFLTRNYDKSFIDSTRVWLKGEASQIALPDDADVIEFTNPLSGRIYVAYKLNGESNETSIGYYLLKLAKIRFSEYPSIEDLQDHFDGSELEFIIGKLEILRGMNKAYEYEDVY